MCHCLICQESVKEGQRLLVIQCQLHELHSFHMSCAYPYVKIYKSCPCCTKSIKPEEVAQIRKEETVFLLNEDTFY
jgi:predicted nucleic acid-binding Zn ribbon protein